MKIKIVTDTSADLSAEIAKELGITIVPLYVRFGDEVFRERVTISDEEFYKRLIEGTIHPSTVQPGPNDFLKVYQNLAQEADGIVSIHISSNLSGAVSSAILAKNMITTDIPLEVIDSQTVSVALGLITIVAAESASQGKGFPQVLEETKEAINNIHSLCLLDTLKYLEKGGRIGKARALLGTVLNIKPLITVKDGEVVPVGQVRSRSKGIEQLLKFVKGATEIEDIAVGYSTTEDDAESLSQQIASIFTKPKVRLLRLGTTLGVHTGPGSLIVSLRGKMPK
jgi:DegV family protein with EDD domain